MINEKPKNLEKYQKVPEWLNSPLWYAKPTPIVEDVNQFEMDENVSVVDCEGDDRILESSLASTSAGVGGKEEGGRRRVHFENKKNGEGEGALTEANKNQKKKNDSLDPSQDSGLNYVYSRPCPSLRDLLAESKIERFSTELSKKVISLRELQLLASEGIPNEGGLRATTWKILLCYLPRNRDIWENELAKKRSKYAVLKQELLLNPDTEIAEQIERDIKRTHPDMPFFSGNSASSLENQEAMKRILLIFAKLNRSIQYVQGMNEVLAPLYYVFKTDPDEQNAVNAEADAYNCFVELLSHFLDHFCQKLDNSAVGIRSTMVRMTELLKKHDEELWRHLDATTKVNPQFYAFRWITLLLTQEFRFSDCLRIWDSLLSNSYGPMEILLRICCAMLICIRSRLLAGDFTLILKLLQHYPSIDINHLLRVADDLRIKS